MTPYWGVFWFCCGATLIALIDSLGYAIGGSPDPIMLIKGAVGMLIGTLIIGWAAFKLDRERATELKT